MAKVRIGISTYFELENELVGIGTDNPTNTLQAVEYVDASNSKAIGLSTFLTYQGFVDTKAAISGGESGSKSGSIAGEIIIEGDVTVSSGTTFTSGPEDLTVTDSFTLPGINDDRPTVGSTRFNEVTGSLEFYTGHEWRSVSSYIDMGNRGRGVSGGGKDPSVIASMTYIEISTLGNTQNFGDLTVARFGGGACSSTTRGIFAGGATPTRKDEIDYVTIASGGDAIDFGNLTVGRTTASSNSGTRAIFWQGGKEASPGACNVIDYVEIATVGNAVDFGDTASGITDGSPGVAGSPTRSVAGGGGDPAVRSDIEYLTISSKGNSISQGDLTRQRFSLGAVSNTTRIVWGGGRSPGPVTVKTMDYATIASLGSAITFGDLTVARGIFRATAATSNRGVWMGGGYASPSPTNGNVMDYITIASAGDAIDFGEMSIGGLENSFACSDANGGLGGF